MEVFYVEQNRSSLVLEARDVMGEGVGEGARLGIPSPKEC